MPRLSKEFQDKIDSWGQEKQPYVRIYCPRPDDKFPFSNEPSGSKWELDHLDWLRIYFEGNCVVDRMFTKKSRLEQSSTIARFLQDSLDLNWSQIINGQFRTGTLYERLQALASWVEPTPAYQSAPVAQSSSPASSQHSDDAKLAFNTHGIPPHSKITGHLIPEDSPSALRSVVSRSAPDHSLGQSTRRSQEAASTQPDPSSRDWDTSSDSSSIDEESAYEPASSLPGVAEKGIDGSNPKTRMEKEVEFAATAFLYMIIEAFKATKADIADSEAEEQDLRLGYATIRGLSIVIDGFEMKSHPDLAVEFLARNTKADLVVEVKTLKNRPAETKLLGQQVSEMLGAALKYRSVHPQEYYTTYIISWHFLECYISRMVVSEQYLSLLPKHSSKLSTCAGPIVRRSQVFDLTDANQRIEFAKLAARIGIELLYQYPTHRGHGTGLIRRLRGVTPSKLPPEG